MLLARTFPRSVMVDVVPVGLGAHEVIMVPALLTEFGVNPVAQVVQVVGP